MTTDQNTGQNTAQSTTDQSTHGHSGRINLYKIAPDFYKAMINLDAAARKGVDPVLAELVKIRASQINHCAFCIDMHVQEARAAGETEARVYLLNAWEEAPGHYTEKEQAALALTEAVTVLTDGFVPDAVYERAAKHLDEAELGGVLSLIVVINSWNRISVATRTTPGQFKAGKAAKAAEADKPAKPGEAAAANQA
ncbi:carboxymuconolactone decarboxylase family protein [Streptomyces sp. H27-D2]|uniref:carboxymuconolactone decarboxylase family protein n=1 Tax=Streptomyces sp. H27-D2 TaxID=3046304 RepID=UPI002DBA253E|nr:carboxymuconolactone decarboxylase family protein [Streptomyces sp. H27-D2]MEC4015960.1 carboxymuconolactone decarboxylase family protein [Streptomyces sp. H27-D2]